MRLTGDLVCELAMQCVNCSFENMPGMSACARCGSVLQFGEACIEPPRASKGRIATRVRRMWHPLRDGIGRVRFSRRQLTLLLPEPVSWSALLWSIIPGLGHLKTRRPGLGWCILSAWLIFLLLTILSLGTGWHFFFRNLMVVTHAVAVVSLFAASLSYHGLIVRALFGLVVFIGLNLLLYRPVVWACSRAYVLLPVPRIGANDVVGLGDVLVCEGPWMRSATWRRGDLVAYRVEALQESNYYVRAGLGLDRIVAVAGDQVRLTKGELYVNGAPPPEDSGPLGLPPRTVDLELEVSAGHYLILPTCLDVNLAGDALQRRRIYERLMRSVSVVGEENIVGRIVFRLRPLKRFGSVR